MLVHVSSKVNVLFYKTGLLDGLGAPARRIEQCQGEADAPVRAVTRRVGIVFAADLEADRLLPNLQNLADLKNERHGPFRVARRIVPVCRRFRTEGESRMGLQRICYEGLKEHLAQTATVLLDCDRPELVHQRASGQFANLLQYDHGGSYRECACAEKVLCPGRIEKRRSYSPDQSEWT